MSYPASDLPRGKKHRIPPTAETVKLGPSEYPPTQLVVDRYEVPTVMNDSELSVGDRYAVPPVMNDSELSIGYRYAVPPVMNDSGSIGR